LASGKAPETKLAPGGAAPAEHMPDKLLSTKGTADHSVITVDGEQWVGGVDVHRLQGWERELHEDFPSTKTYTALFYTALLDAGVTNIDLLVTGLPVSQAKDEKKKSELAKKLTGTFRVTPKKDITVKKAVVIPQPLGAYLDLVYTDGTNLDELEEASLLVIDPGFYSVDWVTLERGEVRSAVAGTSTNAMSVLIEEVDRAIAKDYGRNAGRDYLEQAVRRRATKIMHQGENIELGPYLRAASDKVANQALTKMRQALRSEVRQPDIVLLTGGGATHYKGAAADIYPKAKVIVPEDPVLANVRGFWRFRA
jgi:plasmid segregation protein ParM